VSGSEVLRLQSSFIAASKFKGKLWLGSLIKTMKPAAGFTSLSEVSKYLHSLYKAILLVVNNWIIQVAGS
jgi:hypothetical protein